MRSLDPRQILILLAGVGLIGYVLVGEDVLVYTRRQISRARTEAPGWFTWKTPIPLIVGLALALLMHIWLISFYLVLVSLVFVWRDYQKAKVAKVAQLNDQVAQLVFAFRSIYQLQPVIYNALKESMRRLEDPLRGWIDAALQAYLVTSDDEAMFEALRKRSDNHYLNQFLYILEMSGSATQETVLVALGNLARRLRNYESLRRETQTELASVTSQTAIIQVIGIAVLFFVAAVPMLHDAYESSITAQIVYIFFCSVAVFTSVIIDRRVQKLKESAL
jgi:hypothetical protein